MSNIDYEELIRSPLDDLDSGSGSGWVLALFGLVVGLVTGLLLAYVLGGGDSESETDLAIPVSTGAPIVSEMVAPDYPAGYTELAPGLGARIGELIIGDETIAISVSTVVARNEDVLSSLWPVGGMWWLESASGVVIRSSRVVLGRYWPGVFSVQFPAAPFEGESVFSEASLTERWDQRQMSGSVELPFTGEPFVAPEPVSVAVDQGVTLIVTALELGRFLGKVEWRLQGPERGGRVDIAAVLLDGEGTEVGRYETFPVLLDPSDRGVTEILWSLPFPTDQEGAETVVLEYSVSVVEPTPVAVFFDLGAVPIGR